MAPPTIKIDWDKVQTMCRIHCTGEEIASVLGCSYDTFARRVKADFGISCAEYIKEKSGTGSASLRRLQFKAAEAGNSTMLIWLGKQYLGQKDKMDYSSEDGTMSPKGFNDFYSDDKEADS